MKKLKAKLDIYNKAYATNPIITDEEYEKLLAKYELLYGEYQPPVESTSLTLPIFAPSLKKFKLKKEVDQWESEYKNSKVVSDKIDGISFIVAYSDSIRLYTHSNSETGFDKTHLLPYLNIPHLEIKQKEKMIVRGELAIRLDKFEKYRVKYTSPRNMIAGMINSKEIDKEILKDFSFLAFQLVYQYADNIVSEMTPEIQFNLLTQYGFEIVTNVTKINHVSFDYLKDRLTNVACPYLRDGLVVAENEHEILTMNNPKNKIAFKMLGQVEETTVINVEWNESRLQKLKPRIHYESIFLSNANLSWTSGFNARFITTFNIGPGTKLLMTRSGDVNPYIVTVVQGTTASLPDVKYEWDKTKTDILVNINDNIKVKRICHFFEVLGAKFMAVKTVSKLYTKFNTINQLLQVTLDDLLTVVKQKSAERILAHIAIAIDNITLIKVMEGSSLFVGFGQVKLNNLLTSLPSIKDYLLSDGEPITVTDLGKVDKIDKTAALFIQQLDEFKDFLNDNLFIKSKLSVVNLPVIYQEVETIFKNEVIVFSGDKKLTEKVKLMGAIVDKNVTKRTTLLVVDQVGVMHSKEQMCMEKKIPILSLHDFKKKYNI